MHDARRQTTANVSNLALRFMVHLRTGISLPLYPNVKSVPGQSIQGTAVYKEIRVAHGTRRCAQSAEPGHARRLQSAVFLRHATPAAEEQFMKKSLGLAILLSLSVTP